MNMRIYNGDSNLKAFFDIETDEGFLMKGFKIVDGSNGLFVSAPSEKAKGGKYYDRVRIPKELTDDLLEKALVDFRELGGTTPATENSNKGPFPL